MGLAGSAGVCCDDKSYIFNQHSFKMTTFWPSNPQHFLTYSLSQETWLTVDPLSLKKIYKPPEYYTIAFTQLSNYSAEINEGK